MNQQSVVDSICKITNKENVLVNENMRNHTTFKVGGPADIFVKPKDKKEAAEIVRLLLENKIPYYVIGNGSNLLVSDKGYRGCIICMSEGMDFIEIDGNIITAGAGAILSKVCNMAMESSLSGLVFASGIPGSVGGAIYMNAGAYGGEMKDVVKEVELLNSATGEIKIVPGADMGFAYRTSIVRNSPYIVLSAKFELMSADREEIKSQMNELSAKRREKQPLEYPSAGSTFKRPEGYFAGKLIEDANLKGYRVGGACVSQKHSGFVVNDNNATCEDIITLIRDVRRIVNEKFGVLLEPEVCMLGEGISL